MNEQSSANDSQLPIRSGWENLTQNQRIFLRAYEQVGGVQRAAVNCGLSRAIHAKWKRESDEYRAAFNDLKVEVLEELEAEAHRRALHGVDEPVFHQGRICGHIRKYSDTLLIFLLKGNNPKKYRDQFKGHIQIDGGVDHHMRHEALIAPEFLEQMLEAAKQLGNDGHGSEDKTDNGA
jgi:hypothetical protein